MPAAPLLRRGEGGGVRTYLFTSVDSDKWNIRKLITFASVKLYSLIRLIKWRLEKLQGKNWCMCVCVHVCVCMGGGGGSPFMNKVNKPSKDYPRNAYIRDTDRCGMP